ncbi:PREDICTED: uncharacterized protein LOC104608372 [Nelumbo nucifera]|uniref:Uncharacterized protein LOC104608372 n=1 Tax=Nelumbo nucifera TaxID=4432 RepID=A0A1U8AX61_NELNU|nr:PREDICTED: uncharacterized protein LOC104608372 [Nelumbo nucifera]
MGGKGRRRREKNFLAAHGGYTRLPPPPKPGEVDALPSKLRRIMEFNTTTIASKPRTNQESLQISTGDEHKRRPKQKLNRKDKSGCNTSDFEVDGDDENVTVLKSNDDDEKVSHKDDHDKRKRKRKRKQVQDHRFDVSMQDLGIVGSKKWDRKKRYLEARKMKHKKAKTEEKLDFPGREEIKFGEIVEAPPKLVAFPKALKTFQSASHERLRLQAVEAYRNRKGWVSRPGIHLPPVTATPSP